MKRPLLALSILAGCAPAGPGLVATAPVTAPPTTTSTSTSTTKIAGEVVGSGDSSAARISPEAEASAGPSGGTAWPGSAASSPPPPPMGRVLLPEESGKGQWLAQLRHCESGSQYDLDTGNGYFGAYQFSAGAWQSVGGTGNPADASPDEQDMRAARLLAAAGAEQWPTCGRRA